MRLRTRIIIAVVIACSIINLSLCFYFTGRIRQFELEKLYSGIEKSLYMIRLVTARPLYNVDQETLRANLETFFDDKNMKSISLKAEDINIDISLEREFDSNAGTDISKKIDITYQGMRLGTLQIVYSTGFIEKKLAGLRDHMLYFTGLVIAVLALVLVFVVNKLMLPVSELSRAASEIAAGNLDRKIEQAGVGEIGKLARNFAVMRDAIKEKINDLARINFNLEKQIRLKEINEKKIFRQSRVINAVNCFFQQSMLAESYQGIARIFFSIAFEVIPGGYGFIGEVTDESEDHMDILAVSDQVAEECRIMLADTDKAGGSTHALGGIISEVVFGQKSVILNEPELSPGSVCLPEQHVPVESFMGVPIKLGSEMKGIIAFSGKDGGYDPEDLKACETLALALVEALSLKRREDEKAKLEEMMVHSEKMVSLGGLAAGMAHEINNPLAGILQNAQVIRNRLREKLPANLAAAEELGMEFDAVCAYMEKRKIYRMLDSVLEAGKRAAAIVSNMLSFARKSASGFVKEDICSILDKTIELAASDYNLKKQFDFKKIRIIKEYSPGMPKIRCKASEIQQVFFNILSNGAQAMVSQNSSEQPCFEIRVCAEGRMARVDIIDNGPGMSREVRKRVFEPFFTTKEVGEGTGLGLAVCYFIVTENHKGSIEVNSTPSKGSCFIVRLPFADNDA